MANSTEPIWDYSPTNRIFLWATAGASVLALPPFLLTLVLSTLFGWLMHDPGDKISLSNDVIPTFVIATMLAFLPLVAGALIGLVSVICAPATEPTRPFQSAFFRIVMAQTLLAWLIAFATIWWIGINLWDYYDFHPFSDSIPFIVGFVIFPFCLWRALRMAKRNAQSSA